MKPKEGEMVTVFFQGTFDILNVGHIRAFRIAASKGAYLVVGLNSDSLIRWYKGREPVMPYEERKEIVESIAGVHEVVKCDVPFARNYLESLDVDVYVLTEEWKDQQKEAIDWMSETGKEVVFAPRWDGISSTEIRRRLYVEFSEEVPKE